MVNIWTTPVNVANDAARIEIGLAGVREWTGGVREWTGGG